MKKDLIVYVEYPFCAEKCEMCRKHVYPADIAEKQRYGEALRRELASYGNSLSDYRVSALWLGGGTVGELFDEEFPALVAELRNAVAFAPDCEITLKIQPHLFSEETAKACAACGVNRLSVDYATDSSLESDSMGKPFDFTAMKYTRQWLGDLPIDLSFDLIAGLPRQTEESLRASIDKVIAEGAAHISLTRMDYENTPELYVHAAAYLKKSGFAEYLPGRFAAPGKACAFLEKDAAGVECLGLGLEAYSRLDGVFCRNTRGLKQYIDGAHDPGLIVVQAEEIK